MRLALWASKKSHCSHDFSVQYRRSNFKLRNYAVLQCEPERQLKDAYIYYPTICSEIFDSENCCQLLIVNLSWNHFLNFWGQYVKSCRVKTYSTFVLEPVLYGFSWKRNSYHNYKLSMKEREQQGFLFWDFISYAKVRELFLIYMYSPVKNCLATYSMLLQFLLAMDGQRR